MKRPSILLALCIALGSGCTSFGYGYDDPKGEVSVVGEAFPGCAGGRAFIFGTARNTGELEVRNVTAIVDVFSGGGAFLGRFQGPVSRGVDSVEGVDENGNVVTVDIIDDTLEVDQVGTFHVETSLGCGSAGRTDFTFDFTVATFEDI